MNPARTGRAKCRSCGRLVVHALTHPERKLMRLDPQTSLDGDFIVWWEESEPAGKRIQRTTSVVRWEREEGKRWQGARHRAHEGDLCPGSGKGRPGGRRFGLLKGGLGCR